MLTGARRTAIRRPNGRRAASSRQKRERRADGPGYRVGRKRKSGERLMPSTSRQIGAAGHAISRGGILGGRCRQGEERGAT